MVKNLHFVGLVCEFHAIFSSTLAHALRRRTGISGFRPRTPTPRRPQPPHSNRTRISPPRSAHLFGLSDPARARHDVHGTRLRTDARRKPEPYVRRTRLTCRHFAVACTDRPAAASAR